MFSRGAPAGRVEMEMYDSDFEDFSSGDSAGLDRWVFQRVSRSTESSLSSYQYNRHKSVLFTPVRHACPAIP